MDGLQRVTHYGKHGSPPVHLNVKYWAQTISGSLTSEYLYPIVIKRF